MDITFQVLWVNTKEHDCWIIWQEYVEFCKKLPGCLPQWQCHSAFSAAVSESSVLLILARSWFCQWYGFLTTLIDMRWYLVVVLICNSLMIYDVEHLYIFSFTICTSLVRCLFRPLAHVLSGLFVSLLLSFKSSLCNPDWHGSVGSASSHGLKCRQFGPQSEHVPGLWARPPVGACVGSNWSVFLSQLTFLSPSSLLSKN